MRKKGMYGRGARTALTDQLIRNRFVEMGKSSRHNICFVLEFGIYRKKYLVNYVLTFSCFFFSKQ